jgi:hypothetical protein
MYEKDSAKHQSGENCGTSIFPLLCFLEGISLGQSTDNKLCAPVWQQVFGRLQELEDRLETKLQQLEGRLEGKLKGLEGQMTQLLRQVLQLRVDSTLSIVRTCK